MAITARLRLEMSDACFIMGPMGSGYQDVTFTVVT